MSQSAISQALANLERKADVKLVVRSKPARPTEIGNHLLRHARHVIEQEEQAISELNRFKRGFSQQVSVAVDYVASEFYIGLLVQRLIDKFPEASVHLNLVPARKMVRSVRSGQFDVGIGFFQKDMRGLKKKKWHVGKSYLVTSKRNEGLADPFEFIANSTLMTSYIDDPDERPNRRKIRSFFRNVWQVNSIPIQIQLLKSGHGCSFLAREFLEADSQCDFSKLDRLPFSEIAKPYGVYYSADLKPNAVAKHFIDLCRHHPPSAGAI